MRSGGSLRCAARKPSGALGPCFSMLGTVACAAQAATSLVCCCPLRPSTAVPTSADSNNNKSNQHQATTTTAIKPKDHWHSGHLPSESSGASEKALCFHMLYNTLVCGRERRTNHRVMQTGRACASRSGKPNRRLMNPLIGPWFGTGARLRIAEGQAKQALDGTP